MDHPAGPNGQRLVLRTLLDTYGHTQGLKDGSVRSARLGFSFDEVRPIYDGFSRTIGTDDFDLSELAVAVWLRVMRRDSPWLLLPVGLLTRFHHGSLVHNVAAGIQVPSDLAGKAIGVRAYRQTTAVWARGLLRSELGVDPAAMRWVTFEDSHVPGEPDPPNATRAPAGEDLEAMLLSGRLDAAVVARVRPSDPRVRDLVPDAAAAALAWHRRTGVLPINHMLVIRRAIVDAQPWVLPELARLLWTCRSRYLDRLRTDPGPEPDDVFRADLLAHGIDPLPFGVEAVRPALELFLRIALDDGILDAAVPFDAMFDPRVAVFGELAR